jgi:hypothetical protein
MPTEAAQKSPETTDEKVVLTPAEAISLLADGDTIHNFATGGMIMLGCDYDRAGAIKALNEAIQIEIGGPACKSMKHPLAVWSSNNRVSFFEADMAKVEAMEASKAAASASVSA